MKVKDVVLAAAKTLGLDGVAAYLETGEGELQRESELLIECFNRVEGALALAYLPLYAEDEILTVTDEVEYSSLTYAPVRILAVTNGAGDRVPYKIYPKYLKAQAGRLKITYTYTPDKKTAEEESDFTLNTGEAMFVHGVLAEFCMAEGRLEESAVWEKKYKEGIEAAFRGQTCKRIGSRRWI